MQRQEAKRERKLSLRRPVKKEDKNAPELYSVVRVDDARQGKYLWCDFEGTTLEHAERLAAPVPGQEQRYSVIPVDVHRFARDLGEPINAQKAIVKYEAEQVAA